MTDLTLERIRELGGLVTTRTERREITWVHVDVETGERTTYSAEVEVRRMAFGWIDRVTRETRQLANGHDEAQSVGATLIAGGILFGGESMPYQDALQLEPALANELLRAFYVVNGMTTTDPEDDSAKN